MEKFVLEGIVNSFDTWVEFGICPDCGADLDLNGECSDWHEDTGDKKRFIIIWRCIRGL